MQRTGLHNPTFSCVAALLWLACALPGCAGADGAGVIAYTRIRGEIHLLLADQSPAR